MKSSGVFLVCFVAFITGIYNISGNLPQPPFHGEVFLPVEGQAAVAVAASGANALDAFHASHTLYEQLSTENLRGLMPFQAINRLDKSKQYDAAVLPFVLQVVSTSVIDESVAVSTVTIDTGQEERKTEIAKGSELEINGTGYQVEDIRRWAGLWRHPDGRAMLNIACAIEDGELQESIFVESGDWRLVEPECAIQFRWFDSEEKARASLEQGVPGNKSARWGVEDGGRMLWFEGIQPGAGAVLQDGTEVTLLGEMDTSDEFFSAIEVAIEKDGSARKLVVPANAVSENGRIRFEYPANRRYVVQVAAWETGRAIVRAYDNREPVGDAVIEAGQAWDTGKGVLHLRLDQVMPNALPIQMADSTAYEAVLEGNDRVVRLRHGERVRVDDAAVTFRRDIDPAEVEVRFVANHVDSKKVTTFMLRPGQTFKVLSWNLSLKPMLSDMDAFVLDAGYDPGIALPLWIGGALVLVSTAVALFRFAVIIRRRKTAA